MVSGKQLGVSAAETYVRRLLNKKATGKRSAGLSKPKRGERSASLVTRVAKRIIRETYLICSRWVTRATGKTPIMRHGRRYLRDAFDAGREAGIEPFLMWGTLLGCVREGNIMPHDIDVDLGIRSGDYVKKDAFIAAMRKRGYVVYWDKPYKLKFTRRLNKLIIDVDVFFPWDGRVICLDPVRHDEYFDGAAFGEYFSIEAFDNLKEVNFLDGLSICIPDPPEPVLAAIYGEWQVPKSYAWQVPSSHHCSADPLNRIVFASGQTVPILHLGLRPGY
jgi:hypothetical protein